MPHNTDESNKSNNTADNSAPVSGGIFSTPDLTVSSENVPQNLVSTDDGQMNIIHEEPVQETQPAPADNSEEIIRAPGRSNRTTSSATGDLVLPKSPKKPSKAPFAVAVVVLVALALGGGIYLLLNNRGKDPESSEGGVAKTAEEIQKKFNRQATYMLFGESEDSLPVEYEPDRIYKLDDYVAGEGEDSEKYWKTVSDSLQSVINDYKELENHDENLLVFLEEQQDSIEFLEKVSKIADPSEEEIVNLIIESGAESAKESINKALEPLREYNTLFIKDYVDQKTQQYNTNVDVYNIYINRRCVTISDDNGELVWDYTCLDEALNDGMIREQAGLMAELIRSNLESLQDATRRVESNCWRISSRFTEKPNEENSNTEES